MRGCDSKDTPRVRDIVHVTHLRTRLVCNYEVETVLAILNPDLNLESGYCRKHTGTTGGILVKARKVDFLNATPIFFLPVKKEVRMSSARIFHPVYEYLRPSIHEYLRIHTNRLQPKVDVTLYPPM